MVKTIFYLKTDKENNDGELPIYCKIKYKNTATTMSSGKWITRKRWQATNHLRNPLKVKREIAVKAGLDRISEDVNSAYLQLCNKLEFITALDIKNKWLLQSMTYKKIYLTATGNLSWSALGKA